MSSFRNMALHTDLYQLTMMQTYVQKGLQDQKVVFDMFFRSLPFGNGYAVYAGLEQIIDYLTELAFSEEDIAYLESLGFKKKFTELLRNFRFTGDVYSMREGEIIFPNAPVLTVEARIVEALLIETALLNIFNHQTLIATKASRIKQITGKKTTVDFGARRGHGPQASLYGARAACIGGMDGTSLVKAGNKFKLPVFGTMSHAFVQSFEKEEQAFMAYAEENEGNVVLLVDTYNTLRSGVPNAVKTAEKLKERGKTVDGIRLDSGDMAYLSKEARKMLDRSGFPDIKIAASGDLDEYIIAELENQGAAIDMYAVGTKLITAFDQPSLGGVYKLVEVEAQGKRNPRIKLSDNIEKIITPGRKKPYRIINSRTGRVEGDYITLADERVPEKGRNLLLFDPVNTWKQKTVEDFEAIELQEKVINKGKRIISRPEIEEIRSYRETALSRFWEEHKRKKNPQVYYVDLSADLWRLKHKMIEEMRSHFLKQQS
ncbi:nicotinate phosphoribosyltransferase [Alkalicoccus halolimnae]|uniref:Nicotinate phosphoribosyltransferase n=1 Tax=Alkalicoccus halolimnae TaxID=1667239 RepID=A0A5C7FH51_9BACI|nr:nicotinate phosphoribosyltransferase [Alkalicoccus halolimnae]TXF84300.1 nicotinate phosphoribosyltransferase [Alkalicoccus halolimnae]